MLLEYYGDLATQDPSEVHLMSKLVKHLYELCQMSPLAAASTMLHLLRERQEQFCDEAQARKGRFVYPKTDMVSFQSKLD